MNLTCYANSHECSRCFSCEAAPRDPARPPTRYKFIDFTLCDNIALLPPLIRWKGKIIIHSAAVGDLSAECKHHFWAFVWATEAVASVKMSWKWSSLEVTLEKRHFTSPVCIITILAWTSNANYIVDPANNCILWQNVSVNTVVLTWHISNFRCKWDGVLCSQLPARRNSAPRKLLLIKINWIRLYLAKFDLLDFHQMWKYCKWNWMSYWDVHNVLSLEHFHSMKYFGALLDP